MDETIQKFMEEIKEIEHTHTNIYDLWLKILNHRIQKLGKLITEGREMLKNVKNMPDLTQEQILILYFLSNKV